MEDASPEAADGLMLDDATSRERVLKFEVQMYRLRDGEYVVDFQVSCPAVTACEGSHHIDHLLCFAHLPGYIVVFRVCYSSHEDDAPACTGLPADSHNAAVLQRLQGELFLFMDLCSRMFSTLRL